LFLKFTDQKKSLEDKVVSIMNFYRINMEFRLKFQ
jgi:hypothetical protein